MGRVYIDQDTCTGDGLCVEICPPVFDMWDDGLAYVKDPGTPFLDDDRPRLQGADGIATYGDDIADAVQEAADECPGECIYIEQEDGSWKSA